MTIQHADGRRTFLDFREKAPLAATAAIFLNNGEPFAPGKKLVQKDLAATLKAISAKGQDGFYKGAVGAAIVECDDRGHHVVSAPPPSSGGVIVCEIRRTRRPKADARCQRPRCAGVGGASLPIGS
jgi:gamma-glutamyltranspeptidase